MIIKIENDTFFLQPPKRLDFNFVKKVMKYILILLENMCIYIQPEDLNNQKLNQMNPTI